ncbi:MAG: ABC transporter ATP-binding protein [Steroidobacteraceae bacterium]|nr:ABC transporter ATP-binding protein [Deltaproteobacteria bacterium]
MTTAVIELQGVTFTYPGDIRALDNFTASFVRGRRTAVLGRNGSGKTTLFSLLNGLQRPQSGQILFDGRTIGYDRQSLLKLRQAVGMVFQDPDSQLFSACIYEDISFGPLNLGLPENEVRTRVERALTQMKLSGLENRPTHSLSFGQKKRACIAGVLAMQPQVLVLDEPFAGLDPVMAAEFSAILDELQRGGTTLIIATHDLDLAYAWADQVIVLQEGRLLADGAATEALVRPDVHAELGASPIVAEIAAVIALTGLDVYANGYLPRSRAELVKSIAAKTKGESTR